MSFQTGHSKYSTRQSSSQISQGLPTVGKGISKFPNSSHNAMILGSDFSSASGNGKGKENGMGAAGFRGVSVVGFPPTHTAVDEGENESLPPASALGVGEDDAPSAALLVDDDLEVAGVEEDIGEVAGTVADDEVASLVTADEASE